MNMPSELFFLQILNVCDNLMLLSIALINKRINNLEKNKSLQNCNKNFQGEAKQGPLMHLKFNS